MTVRKSFGGSVDSEELKERGRVAVPSAFRATDLFGSIENSLTLHVAVH